MIVEERDCTLKPGKLSAFVESCSPPPSLRSAEVQR
jgi:hypothetical protein